MARASTYKVRPESDRFWAKVSKGEACWIWVGSRSAAGYGVFRRSREFGHVRVGAHRWAWEDLHGPIPSGLTIDHLCYQPLCVNPAHLDAVTIGENIRRAASRAGATASRCLHGHARRNWERCGECARLRERRRVSVVPHP